MDTGHFGSGITTYFVFLDIPKHIEFRSPITSILPEGIEVAFDLSVVGVPDYHRKTLITGTWKLEKRLLKYGGKWDGLRQYCEWRKILTV